MFVYILLIIIVVLALFIYKMNVGGGGIASEEESRLVLDQEKLEQIIGKMKFIMPPNANYSILTTTETVKFPDPVQHNGGFKYDIYEIRYSARSPHNMNRKIEDNTEIYKKLHKLINRTFMESTGLTLFNATDREKFKEFVDNEAIKHKIYENLPVVNMVYKFQIFNKGSNRAYRRSELKKKHLPLLQYVVDYINNELFQKMYVNASHKNRFHICIKTDSDDDNIYACYVPIIGQNEFYFDDLYTTMPLENMMHFMNCTTDDNFNERYNTGKLANSGYAKPTQFSQSTQSRSGQSRYVQSQSRRPVQIPTTMILDNDVLINEANKIFAKCKILTCSIEIGPTIVAVLVDNDDFYILELAYNKYHQCIENQLPYSFIDFHKVDINDKGDMIYRFVPVVKVTVRNLQMNQYVFKKPITPLYDIIKMTKTIEPMPSITGGNSDEHNGDTPIPGIELFDSKYFKYKSKNFIGIGVKSTGEGLRTKNKLTGRHLDYSKYAITKFNLWIIENDVYNAIYNDEEINLERASLLNNYDSEQISNMLTMTDKFIKDCNESGSEKFTDIEDGYKGKLSTAYFSFPPRIGHSNTHVKFDSSKLLPRDSDSAALRMTQSKFKTYFYKNVKKLLKINDQCFNNWSGAYFDIFNNVFAFMCIQ